jgi:hypothetical protein
MDSHVPQVREASLLHRLFRITPGYAPEWAYLGLGGGCGGSWGGWIAGVALWGALIAGAVAGYALGWCVFPLVTVPIVAISIVVSGGFENRERFGRARLHRGECVWCGRPDTAPTSECPACGRNT